MNEEIDRQREEIRRRDKRETGCLIVVVVFIGFFLLAGLLNPKQKTVDVRVMGQVKQPLLAGPSFELAVWHQHPGNLKNGTLTIWIKGKAVPQGWPPKVHSFESWNPNQENAVTVSCPLKNYDPAEPLVVQVLVKAANARDTSTRFVWQGNRWKE